MTKKQFYTLVTGASSGIGKALAQKCASENMHLILVALPETGLEEYAQQLAAQYQVEAHALALNLVEPGTPAILYETCRQNGWEVNMLINNVGLGDVGAFGSTDHTSMQYMMLLNMHVMVGLTQLFLPQLKNSGNGYILNVSSLAAMFPVPFKSIYSATKSFVYSVSRSLYFELEDDNIMVSCLCPGPTVTNERVQETTNKLGWRARYFTKNAAQVADTAVEQMLKRKFLIIPGWENRMMLWLGKLVPEALLLRYLGKMFQKSVPDAKRSQQEATPPVTLPLPGYPPERSSLADSHSQNL